MQADHKPKPQIKDNVLETLRTAAAVAHGRETQVQDMDPWDDGRRVQSTKKKKKKRHQKKKKKTRGREGQTLSTYTHTPIYPQEAVERLVAPLTFLI